MSDNQSLADQTFFASVRHMSAERKIEARVEEDLFRRLEDLLSVRRESRSSFIRNAVAAALGETENTPDPLSETIMVDLFQALVNELDADVFAESLQGLDQRKYLQAILAKEYAIRTGRSAVSEDVEAYREKTKWPLPSETDYRTSKTAKPSSKRRLS